jgi:hypothetical protein
MTIVDLVHRQTAYLNATKMTIVDLVHRHVNAPRTQSLLSYRADFCRTNLDEGMNPKVKIPAINTTRGGAHHASDSPQHCR